MCAAATLFEKKGGGGEGAESWTWMSSEASPTQAGRMEIYHGDAKTTAKKCPLGLKLMSESPGATRVNCQVRDKVYS